MDGAAIDGLVWISGAITLVAVAAAWYFRRRAHDLGQQEAAARQRLDDFLDSSDDWLWETDEHLRFTTVSQGADFGGALKLGRFLGKTRHELAKEDTTTEKWREHAHVLAAREPYRDFEYRQFLDNGEAVYISASGKPVFRDDGTFAGYRGTASNVTRLVEAREIEKERAKRMRAMLDNCPFSAIVSDYTTREVLYVNRAAEALFGDGLETMVGRRGLFLWADEDDRANLLVKFAEQGHVPLTEARLKRLNGEEFWGLLAWEKIPQFGKDAIISWHLDVSERHHWTDALRYAKEEAEKASNAKSEFLSAMSHELRTPLNAIHGFAQILKSDMKPDAPKRQTRSVAQITDSTEHLIRLVDQLLELNRIEQADLPARYEFFDLGDMLDECQVLVRNQARRKSISVFNSADPGIVVYSDRQRVQQALLNLLTNAIKYNREKGKVEISHSYPDGRLRVSVKDTGMGIPTEQYGKVFTPFERLGREHSTIDGTGIGLSISRRLIEGIGGEIGFESLPDYGSTFWIDLPLAKPASTPDPGRPS